MHTGHTDHHRFHPLVARWFSARIGRPTRIQEQAWPLIAANQHLLVTAPTGSGKTLAAFLWAIDQLIRERWEGGQTRVLYVSPLKALNNDIQRNLIRPLAEIGQSFERHAVPFPQIRVGTRSGDTPPNERRQMIRRPPEILITTPESLHLLLSSHGGRSMLGRIRSIILDEIHAVVGSKRGTLLMTAVERLVSLSGEFQRIALSATVKPAATVAEFIGGFRVDGDPSDPVYVPRQVARCRSGRQRQDTIRVRIPHAVIAGGGQQTVWDDLADTFRRTIDTSRSTIIFTNSRRLCEKLTFLINADRPHPVAYAHHGSLSRELRLEVEKRLKNGDLKAIVATASLELGIDIGSLDQVILVQSPPSISSAVQRIGRSGHGVGEISRATFYATHASDLLTAAVLAGAVVQKEIEPLRPVECPLDVLAQVVVSMTGVQTWDVGRLYHALRASYPFRKLGRRAFDLVVEMLAGRYAATRIASLQPKIAYDRMDNTISARKGALLALYTSGGVIPDRGYYGLRRQETGARIGELDEEFVWEAKKGQVFTLGTGNWRIHRITHNDVFVRPARPRAPVPPFWRADDADRDFYLSDKIARFLETAQHAMAESGLLDQLITQYRLDREGARFLTDFLNRQQEKTGCDLPHRHHVVVEQMPSAKGGAPVRQVVIHTFWGGRVNRPFALALEAAYQKRYGQKASVFPTNDAVYLLLPEEGTADAIMTLVSSQTVEALLRQRLEGSGIFGARFRECAARALLLPRRHFKQRMPLWLTRQKSQRLLDNLGRFNDFPILLETWRTCLQDDFDLAALVRLLQELESGQMATSVVHTASPSPMALSGSWRQINQYMYADDRQPGRVKTDLSRDLLQQVVFTPGLRPAVDPEPIVDFQLKRQRLHPGYAPDSPVELLEWVKERTLLSMPEWQQLMQRSVIDSGLSAEKLLAPNREKLVRLIPRATADADHQLIVAWEMAPAIAKTLYAGRTDIDWVDLEGNPRQLDASGPATERDLTPTAADILAQWIRFYGPVTAASIENRLGLEKESLSGMLTDLIQTRQLIAGRLIRGRQSEQVCDADNYDSLLRLARHRQAPDIEPRAIRQLALALAHYQGLTRPEGDLKGLVACLQPLMCLSLPAAVWETEILPARLGRYDPRWMDRLMQEAALMWVGRQGRRVAFCHEDDLDLMMTDHGAKTADAVRAADAVRGLIPDSLGRYRLSALLGDPPRPAHRVLERLWAGVWAGKVTNDSMVTLRQGIARKFQSTRRSNNRPMASHGFRARSRTSRRAAPISRHTGSVGNWRIIPKTAPPEGLLEAAEILKDRVRLLLDRYGILFRQILARELAPFRWVAIFRALRLMELSGEVMAGCFFNDLPGLQFVSPRMLRLLRKKLPQDRLYWLCAQDPASLCGLGIDALKAELPRRSGGTHLVYLGSRLAMVSTGKGKRLQVHLPMDHQRLPDTLVVFDHLLGRSIDPLPSISVETINDHPAADSRFVEVLRRRYDTMVEAPKVIVYRPMANR